ncbi:hypothetical protein AGDE_16278 [Angomonas deanei]|uniref:Uncharacterized protein n=1 Tax=Angomonas deanei TaxID=59799 RepID=A0A7G2C487_9TRYP|nr:hypothetical protein AGDE_16278 [Angomonas deanei]CAD2213543.1 hypothetical protein, conserved [Angomonas deanei]|eukprot:EPY17387.1 hypothetical protein AGDE_16278 [Angomonas deanei]
MLQFAVEKENETRLFTYTDRVLSVNIDGAHLVYLSRKDFPEDLTHHKLHVSEIQLWPHFTTEYLQGVADPEHGGMLTFTVYATELKPLPVDIARVKGEPAPPPPPEPAKGTLPDTTHWRLRVHTFEQLKDVVTTIRRTPDDNGESPVVLKGKLDDVKKQLGMGVRGGALAQGL